MLPTDTLQPPPPAECAPGSSAQGKWVTVQLKDGREFEGVLHTCNKEDNFATLLYMVRERLPPTAICPKPQKAMTFLGKDIVQIVARDVDIFEDDDRAEARKNQGVRHRSPEAPARGVITRTERSVV